MVLGVGFGELQSVSPPALGGMEEEDNEGPDLLELTLLRAVQGVPTKRINGVRVSDQSLGPSTVDVARGPPGDTTAAA